VFIVQLRHETKMLPSKMKTGFDGSAQELTDTRGNRAARKLVDKSAKSCSYAVYFTGDIAFCMTVSAATKIR
jgi:hypothetical protein